MELDLMRLERIMLAVNFEEGEDAPLRWAASLAKAAGAEVKIVNILESAGIGGDDPDALRNAHQSSMNREVSRMEAVAVQALGELIADEGYGAAGALLRCAKEWNADLIILGSHPRTGLAKLFDSSVAKGIVQNAHCAVLLAKKPD